MNMNTMPKLLVTYFAFAILVLTKCIVSSLQCRNEEGDPVDWFYIYKLPKQANHSDPLIRNGVGYMYMTSLHYSNGWIMSEKSIGDTSSMPGQTLSPMYENSDLISIVYNDQPPMPEQMNIANQNEVKIPILHWEGGTASITINHNQKSLKDYTQADNVEYDEECGHTKGVVLGDNKSALWLVHSVPKYPPIPNSHSKGTHYSYPTTGTKFGQTFLCMSLYTTTLNDIAVQLQVNEPMVLFAHVPRELGETLPNLVAVANNKTIDRNPWYSTKSFSTLAGFNFTSFAKSRDFKDDLYSGLVAPRLRSDMVVETWSNGPGRLDSACNLTYRVQNIQALKIELAQMQFTSHHDHSKWTTSTRKQLCDDCLQSESYWICVGDINRAISQESRGGGTVCTSNKALWESFSGLVDLLQDCQR